MLLGLWDDIRHISPRLKIAGQMLAAAMLLSQGIGANVTGVFVQNVVSRLDWYAGMHIPQIAADIVSYTTSGVLTRGAGDLLLQRVQSNGRPRRPVRRRDGHHRRRVRLSGGHYRAAIWRVFDNLHSLAEFINREGVRLVVALALLGAILGFVPYNFNPGQHFHGRHRQHVSGLLLRPDDPAAGRNQCQMAAGGHGHVRTAGCWTRGWRSPRRYVAGRSFFSADRHHFHHQLVDRGLSVKQAVLVSYVLTLFFVLCGVGMVYVRTRYALAFYMVLFGSVIVAAYKMGLVHERDIVTKTTSLAAGGSTAPVDERNVDGVLEIRKEQPVLEL